MAPKPILKKPATSASSTSSTSTAAPDPPAPSFTTPTGKPLTPQAHALAISHAQSLQIRKALEASILLSIETLLDFPTTPTPPTDIPALKYHLRYLQPSDYDTLIQERNIADRCGYPLCSQPRKKLPGKASKFALVNIGRRSMRFVPREQLERFCSEGCARQGLWIKLQLSEEPAWLRKDVVDSVEVDEHGVVSGLDLVGVKVEGEGILLLEEAEAKRRGWKEEKGMKWTKGDEGDMLKLAEELDGLGIESRDLLKKEEAESGEKPARHVEVSVTERETSGDAMAPSFPEKMDVDDGNRKMKALSIEGYVPRKGPDDYRSLVNTLRGKRSETRGDASSR